MNNRFIENPAKITGDRVASKDLLTPLIRAEFYVRLYSLLKFDPDITYEGYEFYIKDSDSGMEFSAGLTGFGPGYFSKENSEGLKEVIKAFDQQVFDNELELMDCKIEIAHDFGKSIFGCADGKIIEEEIVEE